MRFTTVNTDAGVKNGKAAVAYWIRSNDVWKKGSKALKTPNLTSGEAELIGIVVALHTVVQDEFLRTADMIVVNTDSTDAIHRLQNDKHILPSVKPILDDIYKVIPKNKMRFKWVRGHSSKNASRNWVNNWCDREVRKLYEKEELKTKIEGTVSSEVL